MRETNNSEIQFFLSEKTSLVQYHLELESLIIEGLRLDLMISKVLVALFLKSKLTIQRLLLSQDKIRIFARMGVNKYSDSSLIKLGRENKYLWKFHSLDNLL